MHDRAALDRWNSFLAMDAVTFRRAFEAYEISLRNCDEKMLEVSGEGAACSVVFVLEYLLK